MLGVWVANQQMLALHNAERAKRGLPPLGIDWRLAGAAMIQAIDCARLNRLSHQGADGSWPWDRIRRQGYTWGAASENAAMQPPPPRGWPGETRTPEWALSGWLQSPGHRANVLGPYAHIGAGYADAADGTRYWIITFARP